MTLTQKFLFRLKRVHYGLESRREFIYSCSSKLLRLLLNINNARRNMLLKTRREGDAYCIKDVRLPVVKSGEEGGMRISNLIDDDIFCSYLCCNDDYSEKTFELCQSVLGEGLYGLVDDKVNVTVEAGDIVIDAGSCCGSFSAYASVKGAVSYAFEPVPENFEYVLKTAKLNKNIIPVNKGLSDENTSKGIFIDPEHYSGSSFLQQLKPGIAPTTVETVRLDDFVRENNLSRVDFIKADIEGFERHMLAGAQETLRRFAPKLALCTYHLPDDPEVMASLILKANPKYNIIQKRKKLFASVPKN